MKSYKSFLVDSVDNDIDGTKRRHQWAIEGHEGDIEDLNGQLRAHQEALDWHKKQHEDTKVPSEDVAPEFSNMYPEDDIDTPIESQDVKLDREPYREMRNHMIDASESHRKAKQVYHSALIAHHADQIKQKTAELEDHQQALAKLKEMPPNPSL